MRPAEAAARRQARARAGAAAARLRGDLTRLLEAEAPDAADRCRGQVRAVLVGLEQALDFGLGFDRGADRDLGLERGHARNVALVIRRYLQQALGPGVDPAARRWCLAQAAARAEELIGTIGWIQRRLGAIETDLFVDGWSDTCSGRLLGAAAWLLPASRRRDFIEDQCGNLEQVESWREWVRYVLSLLVRMPEIAAAARQA